LTGVLSRIIGVRVGQLHQLPGRMKDKARRQQSSTITRAGFDAALIAADAHGTMGG
jgi:hypothetical protein